MCQTEVFFFSKMGESTDSQKVEKIFINYIVLFSHRFDTNEAPGSEKERE
jgi:hypothetical protein